MRRFSAATFGVAFFVSACASSGQVSHAYYLSRPTAQMMASDSATPVLVYFDERTLLWLDSVLLVQRHQFKEAGVCLHIAKDMRDGFKVDSFINGIPTAHPDSMPTSWRRTWFTCPGGWAPLHFHVITPKDSTWLTENGHTEYLPVSSIQCLVAGDDVNPYWSRFPFNALICGHGVDSVYTYRVKP